MEDKTLVEVMGYLAVAMVGGISIWSGCRYVINPVIQGIKEGMGLTRSYNICYQKAVEERGKIAIELGKSGRSPDDISRIVNSTVPLPQDRKEE